MITEFEKKNMEQILAFLHCRSEHVGDMRSKSTIEWQMELCHFTNEADQTFDST